jgi:uncharacterized membrane protein
MIHWSTNLSQMTFIIIHLCDKQQNYSHACNTQALLTSLIQEEGPDSSMFHQVLIKLFIFTLILKMLPLLIL